MTSCDLFRHADLGLHEEGPAPLGNRASVLRRSFRAIQSPPPPQPPPPPQLELLHELLLQEWEELDEQLCDELDEQLWLECEECPCEWLDDDPPSEESRAAKEVPASSPLPAMAEVRLEPPLLRDRP